MCIRDRIADKGPTPEIRQAAQQTVQSYQQGAYGYYGEGEYSYRDRYID